MAQGSGRKARGDRVVNAMTVDVEDYFQVSAFASVVSQDRWHEYESRVAANTDRLLGIFAEFGVRATFFVLGWVAERDPSIVRRIATAGHEIASHGHGHRLVYDLTPQEFRDDVRRTKELLESVTGQPVVGYRAPSFSITKRSLWALDVLMEEGFVWDASVFPIRHDRYGIPTAPRHPFWVSAGVGRAFPGLKEVEGRPAEGGDRPPSPFGFGGASNRGDRSGLLEIPASTIRLAGMNLPVGGGGYFRLLPYWWTRFGIRRVNELGGMPVVFYVHPWELDPHQPRLPASALSRFRHYHNLSRTESRLRWLLSEFAFGPVGAAFGPVGVRGQA